MEMEEDDEIKISAEQARKILKSNGLEVSVKQAGIILDFLYRLANVAIEQFEKYEEG